MQKKLEANEYSSAPKFFNDFKLMLNNCFSYNAAGTPVHNAGLDLQRVFDEKWAGLPPLHPTVSDEEEDEEDDELYSLRFACVFFRCVSCNEPVNFPRVLAHSCAREARLGFRNLAGEEAWLWKRLDALPWNHDGARVEWDGQVARAAMAVIRACGCDPRIVDQGDMDEEAAWLACATCEGQTGGKEREVFGWRRAVWCLLMGSGILLTPILPRLFTTSAT